MVTLLSNCSLTFSRFFLGIFPDVSPIFESNFSNVGWRSATMFCKFIFKMLLTFSTFSQTFCQRSTLTCQLFSTCQNDCLRSNPHLRSISLHCSPSVVPWTALTCNAPPFNHQHLDLAYHPPNIPNQAPVKKPKQSLVLMNCLFQHEGNKQQVTDITVPAAAL